MAARPKSVAAGALVLLVVIAGMLAMRLPRSPGDASPYGAPAGPNAAAVEETFPAVFLPLVERALSDAGVLVATGEARERNLLRIRGQQEAMLESLAVADAWLAEHPPPPAFMPATTAYHDGATMIRGAMDEAQAGFLRLDFDRVARATEAMKQGDASLRLATTRLRAAHAATPLPRAKRRACGPRVSQERHDENDRMERTMIHGEHPVGRDQPDDTEQTPEVPDVRLLSVNVGEPRVIGTSRWGKPIRSGIVKQPVTSESVYLDSLNLAGDRQADLIVHGGSDKAVYAYPSEHLPLWNHELGTDFGPGTFGENLTTAGWLEDDVRIGDIWSWGDALVQVAQPRYPCYKLATVTGRPDLPKRFIRTGRTGWYLRVLRPAIVPVAGPIRVIERDPSGVSVLRAHRALLPELTDRAEVEAVAGVQALATSWREALLDRLEQT